MVQLVGFSLSHSPFHQSLKTLFFKVQTLFLISLPDLGGGQGLRGGQKIPSFSNHPLVGDLYRKQTGPVRMEFRIHRKIFFHTSPNQISKQHAGGVITVPICCRHFFSSCIACVVVGVHHRRCHARTVESAPAPPPCVTRSTTRISS